MHKLIKTTSDKEFVDQAVHLLSAETLATISARREVMIGLSGGSTPKPIYEALGKEKGIDWSKVWLFLVDDRYVAADDPRSNQFLLRSTLLKNAPIPESQIIFPDTSLPIDECVSLYEKHVADLLKKGPPDLIILGMGDDGHVASLFPPVPDEVFGERLVIHTTTDSFDVHDRISVTMSVLTQAKQSLFLLKGDAKQNVWEEMMKSPENETRWPAKSVIEKTQATVLTQW